MWPCSFHGPRHKPGCRCISSTTGPLLTASLLIFHFFQSNTERRHPTQIMPRGTTAAHAADILRSSGVGVLLTVSAFVHNWSVFRRLLLSPGSQFLTLAVNHMETALTMATAGHRAFRWIRICL